MSSSAFCLYNILRNITKVCCSCGLGPLGRRPMTTSNVCYATHGGSPNEAPPKFRHVSNGGPPNSPSNEARPNSPPNHPCFPHPLALPCLLLPAPPTPHSFPLTYQYCCSHPCLFVFHLPPLLL